MYVKTIKIEIKRTQRSRHSSKKMIICKCDQCLKQFSQKYTKKRENKIKSSLNFCSRICCDNSKRKNGLLMKQTQRNRKNDEWKKHFEKTMIERYGVVNPGQMFDHVAKTSRTLLNKNGVSNALQLPQARKRSLETNNTPEAKRKRRETTFKTYGVHNVFASNEIKKKIQKTLLSKYGVKHSSYITQIYKKRSKTCIKNYGVKHGLLTKHSKKNAKKTFIKNYEAETYWQSKKYRKLCQNTKFRKKRSNNLKRLYSNQQIRKRILKKRHETMKRNKTYGKSKPENKLYESLVKEFPSTRRQEFINGWAIDFYVPELDIYIQLDGVYWHGLDRCIADIEKSTSPKDKTILKTIDRDKKQICWFFEQGKTLKRFRDTQNIKTIINELKSYNTSHAQHTR